MMTWSNWRRPASRVAVCTIRSGSRCPGLPGKRRDRCHHDDEPTTFHAGFPAVIFESEIGPGGVSLDCTNRAVCLVYKLVIGHWPGKRAGPLAAAFSCPSPHE